MDESTASFFADLIMIVHFLVLAFVIGSVILVWIGHFREWSWIRNFTFRAIHGITIGVVALQAIFGVICPLTTWEQSLREQAHEAARERLFEEMIETREIPDQFRADETFIQRWLGRLLFPEDAGIEIPFAVLTAIYCLFFLFVLFTFYWVRPRRPGAPPAPGEDEDSSEPPPPSTS